MTPAVRIPPLLLIMLLLHAAVAPQLRVLDVAADLPLLLAISAGIVGGPQRGLTIGFAAGLGADLLLHTPFGLAALAYCLVGWGVGSFQTRVLHAIWWIPVVTAALATAAGTLLFVLLGAVVGQEQLLTPRLPVILALTALWAAVLSRAMVRVVRWALMVDASRLGMVPRSMG